MKPKNTLAAFLFAMFLILVTCLTCSTVYAQNIKDEIRTVENNLLPPILVNDQPAKKFTIEDRMKHHNVPGVSIAVVQEGKLH